MRSLWDYATSALLSVGVLLFAAGPAAAQTLVNPGQKPAVEVDTSVLDHLGEVPTLPDLFLGRRPVTQATPSAVAPHLAAVHRPYKPAATRSSASKAKQARHAAKKPTRTVSKQATKAALSAPAKAPQHASAKPALPARVAAAPTPPTKEPDLKPLPQPLAAEPPAAQANPPEPQPASESKPAAETPPAAEAKPAAEPRTVTEAKPPAEPPKAVEAAPPAEPTAKLPPVNLPVAVPASDPGKPAATPEPRLQTTLNTPAAPPAAPQLPARQPVPAPTAPPPAAPAALTPPADTHMTDSSSTIPFAHDDARLPEDARKALMQLAGRMADDGTLQVQLLAYAEGNEDNASKARRLSLSRALAVRSFLIDQGVRSTRIEVRALGNKVLEGTPDRVDILVQKR